MMSKKSRGDVSIHMVGDLGPNREDPESIFALSASVLKEADIRFGQLEAILSERSSPQVDAGLDLCADPQNVSALTFAGFDVISFTANHGLDFGFEAFTGTIETLRKNNIQVVGAGNDLAEARRPAIIARNGTRVGFLAFCSVPGRVPPPDKPGVALMRASTFYEQFDPQPGTPPRIITIPNREDLEALQEDIEKTKRRVDVLIVSMHWGVHFVPAEIPMYEWEVGHAALDAGADLIVGGHPHIIKGVEVYKGKVIFHSLSNFAFDFPPEKTQEYLAARIRARSQFYPAYFHLDPKYPTYPFPPDCRMTMVARCVISDKHIQRVSFLPAMINEQGQPCILTRRDRDFDEVLNYMKYACEDQGLDTTFRVEGNEVLINM